ncbi:hypothetical protein PF006_g31801 [Phytophthora fragariae]|uniref:Uncharacterized protein n=1 Tax=Phytophthora fragariae TaxID=53985 RepID=A0A6A3PRS9_9STRA|nr:hypothetical protein PF006_g31801 [Phytophthora fragariae]
MEDGDAYWGLDSSVDISCNEEVFRSPDGEAPVQHDPDHEAGDLLLNFELPIDVSAAELMPPIESVVTTTSEASASTTPTSASLPSLPSLATRDRIAEVQNGDAQGVDKANNAKRRDFGSIYTEAADKRLQLSEKRMRLDLELRERKLEQEDRFHRYELKERERDRLQRAADKRAEEKNRMALQLLLNGKSLDEVNAILQVFFPN